MAHNYSKTRTPRIREALLRKEEIVLKDNSHQEVPFKIGLFVLNLNRRPDRLKEITDQLTALGIPDFEVVEAVDGFALTEEEVSGLVDVDLRKLAFEGDVAFSRGEIGCSASHNKIYNRMIDESYSHAIILEDDAVIGKSFAAFWSKVLSQGISHQFDTVLLGYTPRRAVKLVRSEITLAGVPVSKFRANSRMAVRIWGTHGYLISQTGARKILSVNNRIKFIADEIWNIFVSSYSLYAFDPKLVEVSGSDTDITKRGSTWQIAI